MAISLYAADWPFAIFKVLTGEHPNPRPFCKAYTAEGEKISKIVATIVPRLGNRILVFDVEKRAFTTDFVERGSLERLWQDSYSITISEEENNRTVVRVLRTLYIRRGGQLHRQPSDGHNEKWILTQIEDGLTRQ